MATDELVALLVQVIQRPDDAELRRRAAELLEQRGASAETLAVLAPLVNFTGHEEDPPLPCLCKTCLVTATGKAPERAETGGMSFTRAFAVSGSRVLYFWLADELAEQRAEVRRAVGDALKRKLARKTKAGGGGAGGDDGDDGDDDDDYGDDDE